MADDLAPLPDETPTPAEGGRRASFRAVPWRAGDVLIGLAPVLALRAAAELVPRHAAGETVRWLALAASLLGQVWMLAYPLWVARRRYALAPPPPRPGRVATEAALAVPTLFAVWMALGVGLTAWGKVSGEVPQVHNPLAEPARSPDRTPVLVLMAWAVTVAPLAEETFFRGLLYNALRQWLPWPLAAVLQGLAFGFLHTFGLVHAAAASFLGLSLALFYEWRKTLLAPVLLHALQNLVASVVTLALAANTPVLGVTGSPDAGECRIAEVLPGSAADEAGLRAGDVITAVDGRPVATFGDIAEVLRGKRAGDRVTVDFTRAGEAHRVEAVLKKPDS